MKQNDNQLEPRLKDLLDLLRPVPPLDPVSAAQARADFLAQADHYRMAVSTRPKVRHMEWIEKITLIFKRKEQSPMLSSLLTIVVALSFLFGGAGTTVYAAQSSLPDQPLYPVKTWSEDVRLAFMNSTQTQLELVLEYTDRRMAEIAGLHSAGLPIPSETQARFQEQLDLALGLCAGLENPQMVKALTQVRLQAESQIQALQALLDNPAGLGDPALQQLQTRLREQARLAGQGEINPDAIRDQIRDRDRDRLNIRLQTPQPTRTGVGGEPPAATSAGAGNSFGPGQAAGGTTTAPGGYGPGPNSTDPASGQSGPGPQACTATCTPALDGTGPGPGPQATGITSGGVGPGPQIGSATCTPIQDGSGPGPGLGPVNPSATPEPPSSGPGPQAGQPSATPEPGNTGPGAGSPGSGQPTSPPGNGDRP